LKTVDGLCIFPVFYFRPPSYPPPRFFFFLDSDLQVAARLRASSQPPEFCLVACSICLFSFPTMGASLFLGYGCAHRFHRVCGFVFFRTSFPPFPSPEPCSFRAEGRLLFPVPCSLWPRPFFFSVSSRGMLDLPFWEDGDLPGILLLSQRFLDFCACPPHPAGGRLVLFSLVLDKSCNGFPVQTSLLQLTPV